MPQWQGKTKGSKAGYKIFVYICRKIGVFPAYFVLYLVALYYFLFSWDSSKHIYQHYRKRIGFGRIRSFFNIYKNYYIFGQTLIDKFVVMGGIENKLTFTFDGEQNLHDIVSLGRGGILLSGHVGNWEVAGDLLKRLNTKINIVVFDAEHQWMKEYSQEILNPNFNLIVMKDDMSHVYQIGDALHRNELICLHADRFVGNAKTLEVEFFGKKASFPVGPFAIATTFKVPVSVVFAFKESFTHYHFYGSPPIEFDPNRSKDEYIRLLAGTFVDLFEKMVRKYPEQWFNYFKFGIKSNAS